LGLDSLYTFLQRTFGLFRGIKQCVLGWSAARHSTYGLNIYLQAMDHTPQRITVHAEILGSSNLITLLPL